MSSLLLRKHPRTDVGDDDGNQNAERVGAKVPISSYILMHQVPLTSTIVCKRCARLINNSAPTTGQFALTLQSWKCQCVIPSYLKGMPWQIYNIISFLVLCIARRQAHRL